MEKKLNWTKIIIVLLILIIIILGASLSYYLYQLSPVSNSANIKEITIAENTNGNQIASLLKDNHLIRNITVFKLYIRLNNISSLKSGIYQLSEDMGVNRIVDIISKGKGSQIGEINILFKEGKNIRQIAKTIASNTVNTEKDVFDLLKDNSYIDSLILKYWFLTDDIKNPSIYYPLEGYLAPDTYRFANNKVKVREIFKAMLDQTNRILTPYKASISLKGLTVHQFMTMASIVESEGVSSADRPKIASVFYNRLDDKWSLGSCATACYAAKYDGACTPSNVDMDFNSPYNTYPQIAAGKLPIGPISNPGAASIQATLNSADTDYFYFISDKYKRTYFFKANEYSKREQKIQQLIEAGLWF